MRRRKRRSALGPRCAPRDERSTRAHLTHVFIARATKPRAVANAQARARGFDVRPPVPSSHPSIRHPGGKDERGGGCSRAPGDDTARGPTRRFVTDFLTSRAPSLDPPTDAPRRSDSADELLILNYKLPCVAPHLWHRCERRYCADGGANRLFDDMPRLFPDHHPDAVRAAFVPDVIVGDLDSVRPEVLAHYREAGARCVDLSADQDSTDLHKAVTHMVDSA